jgi:hypothetical protein
MAYSNKEFQEFCDSMHIRADVRNTAWSIWQEAYKCGEKSIKEKVKDIFDWLLGKKGEFRLRGEGEGNFWWRRELNKKIEEMN